MSVVDLHPEDLLDRDARGELDPSGPETERLVRHLAQCKTCRLERQVRVDFSREEESLGPEFDVQRLLSEVLAPGTDRELLRVSASDGSPRRRSAARRLRPMLLVAATLFAAGASAAAGWQGMRLVQTRSTLVLTAGVPTGSVGSTESAGAKQRTAAVELASPEAPMSPVASPLAAPASRVASPPEVVTIPSFAVSALPGERVASTRPVSVAALPPAPPVLDASALFERANRARRAGDHERASDLYRTLVDRYPMSAEGHEAQAVLGRLLLGDGDASHALGCFDAYLRDGGSLREDVMADRARALARLGRAHDEAEAWGALLHLYPSSVHAEWARGRLRELGAP